MATLENEISDIDVLLSLAPEELAGPLLRIAVSSLQNGIVSRYQSFTLDAAYHAGPNAIAPYDPRRSAEVGLAVSEAMSWLISNGLLVSAPQGNGEHGFVRPSRQARRLLDADAFTRFREAAAFPKSLLHEAIADRVWAELARSNFEGAVFTAFKAVEEAVRAAGGFELTDVGVPLMRKAFHHTTGPLRKDADPEAEREALAHLFAGAVGSYKNPHSHRTVTIKEPREAQEIVLLASHLLRIVDARKPA